MSFENLFRSPFGFLFECYVGLHVLIYSIGLEFTKLFRTPWRVRAAVKYSVPVSKMINNRTNVIQIEKLETSFYVSWIEITRMGVSCVSFLCLVWNRQDVCPNKKIMENVVTQRSSQSFSMSTFYCWRPIQMEKPICR